ncbi:hypothetical protein BN2476_230220 [Paraburkholderia piptadeniae]|uniref:Uncharacterized protein n=1 Tax=Paraburkholderia piptadeniae TaxID=1701573 RepID=A0A1N7RXD6_9BURK|nr:hypothetical protein [Paraburkholderia piptadeniae]SIT39793.1 hypothetical protein BN2476_230220 [Paraburkholderia piptadeniae]
MIRGGSFLTALPRMGHVRAISMPHDEAVAYSAPAIDTGAHATVSAKCGARQAIFGAADVGQRTLLRARASDP